MKVGDKVEICLSEEINRAKKAKKSKPYVNPSVLELWEALNGRTGTVCKIEGDEFWVQGPQGLPRMFIKEVLKKVNVD